jgi:choline dehydrogenase-like flavoprotein
MSPSTTPQSFCSRPFDYLIVGGGTAGLVVAARLSENPEITVGVIEAGPAVFDEPLINIPGKFGESLGSKYDWQFETTPQPGIGGRKLSFPRGKVLGGTSALNFMTWNRGNKEDYDAWEELGNEGWGWDSLL